MVHIDVPRVRGKMAEHNYNITSLAKVLEIDRNTLASYLNRPQKMPYDILSRMAEILCDTPGEAESIFFAHNLRNA